MRTHALTSLATRSHHFHSHSHYSHYGHGSGHPVHGWTLLILLVAVAAVLYWKATRGR